MAYREALAANILFVRLCLAGTCRGYDSHKSSSNDKSWNVFSTEGISDKSGSSCMFSEIDLSRSGNDRQQTCLCDGDGYTRLVRKYAPGKYAQRARPQVFVGPRIGRLDVEQSNILTHFDSLSQVLMTSFVVSIDQVNDMDHDTSSDGGRCIVSSFEGEDGLSLYQCKVLDGICDCSIRKSVIFLVAC